MPTLKDYVSSKLAEAESITKSAESQGRSVNPLERDKVKKILAQVDQVQAAIRATDATNEERKLSDGEKAELREEIGRMTDAYNAPPGGHGFAGTLLSAGWNFKSEPRVVVPLAKALGATTKANTFPAVTDWSRTEPVLVQMGQDKRFLHPNLVIQDAGDAGSIQDFKQTVRTLTGTVKRALDASSDKANLDVTLEIVNEALAQFAVTINDIPNALFETVEPLRSFLDQEARFQVQTAIDAHVVAQIVAAGPAFGNAGTTMVDKIRLAIGEMRTLGASPDIVALNQTDSANLDLLADAGGYVFSTRRAGEADPLFDLQIVEMPGSTPPYVIDSRMLGVLYMGSLDFAIDPFTGFKKNLSTLRAEVKALYHVRNIQGARRIAAA